MQGQRPELLPPIRRLTVRDAERLTDLYRRVEITRENYIRKASDPAVSFENCGGMFSVNDLETNRKILSCADDVVLGCESDDGGDLCGMIWYNFRDRSYPFDRICYFEEAEPYRSVIERAVAANTIFPGKEIIVLPEAVRGLSRILFKTLLTQASEAGFRYKSGEVYHWDAYEDETGLYPCNLLNMPSYRTLLHTGGIPVGTAPRRTIRKDGLTFYVTPHVFLWNIDDAVKMMDSIGR